MQKKIKNLIIPKTKLVSLKKNQPLNFKNQEKPNKYKNAHAETIIVFRLPDFNISCLKLYTNRPTNV